MGAPVVTEMRVIPVAGYDSMLLNLSGAHGPLFTRNIVILKDRAGQDGQRLTKESFQIIDGLSPFLDRPGRS